MTCSASLLHLKPYTVHSCDAEMAQRMCALMDKHNCVGMHSTHTGKAWVIRQLLKACQASDERLIVFSET